MAELEPYPDLPAEPLTPGQVAAQRHAATWAHTFEPSTTNLALRARHKRDIQEYAATVEEQRMLAQQEKLLQNKAALQYELRSRGMDMKERMDEFNMGLQQRKIANAEEAQGSMLELRAIQEEAAKSRMIRESREEARKLTIEREADNLLTELNDIYEEEGSPAFDAALLSLDKKYPRARLNDGIKTRIKSAEANAEIRRKEAVGMAQEAEAKARAEAAGYPASRITAKGDTFAPPKPVRTLTADQKLLADEVRRAQTEFNAAAATWRQMKAKEPKMKGDKGIQAVRDFEANVESLRGARDIAVANAKAQGLDDTDLAERKTPDQIRDEIKQSGGTIDDFKKALQDAGYSHR